MADAGGDAGGASADDPGDHDSLTVRWPSRALFAITAPASAVIFTPNSSSTPSGFRVPSLNTESADSAADRMPWSASSKVRSARASAWPSRATSCAPGTCRSTSTVTVSPLSVVNSISAAMAAPGMPVPPVLRRSTTLVPWATVTKSACHGWTVRRSGP